MFEKFFAPKPKGPESAEMEMTKIAGREISRIGVNGPGIQMAFEAAKKENGEKNYGLTNNHLLNIVRDCARGQSSVMDDVMYGGAEQTFANIDAEIESIRKSLSEEEQGS